MPLTSWSHPHASKTLVPSPHSSSLPCVLGDFVTHTAFWFLDLLISSGPHLHFNSVGIIIISAIFINSPIIMLIVQDYFLEKGKLPRKLLSLEY